MKVDAPTLSPAETKAVLGLSGELVDDADELGGAADGLAVDGGRRLQQAVQVVDGQDLQVDTGRGGRHGRLPGRRAGGRGGGQPEPGDEYGGERTTSMFHRYYFSSGQLIGVAMGSIEGVDEADLEKVRLLASALHISEGRVVGFLLKEFAARRSGPPSKLTPSPGIAIHAVYEGIRTEAVYQPETRSVQIKTGPLAGREFKSPSGAAIAVVQATNPAVHPNRNGWTFWAITESGDLLQSIRKRS